MPPNSNRLYQAVLRDKTAPISLRLRRTFGDWLVTKGLPAPEQGRPSQEFEADGVRARMDRKVDCGRYVLEETGGRGPLRTQVTYAESVAGMTGWVVVRVEGDGESHDGHAPDFVQAYLRTARITDGAVHLTDTADAVDEDGVHRLVHLLAERDRRVPVIVVSADPQDPQGVRARAEHLAGAVAGAGVVVRLADLRAQDRFNGTMGSELGVFGAGIRTYVAPFDPAAECYPYRHRPMGGPMLRRQGGQALELVAGGAIGETARRPLPDDLQRAYQVVSRILAGKAQPGDIAAAVAPRPAPAGSAREELRRRMMAMTVRPGPVAATAVPVEEPAVAAGAAGAAAGPEDAAAATEPEDAGTGRPASEVAELAQAVAAVVVKELRGELDAALDLTVSSAGNGTDNREILRQMRTLGARVDGLRDLIAVRPGRDRPPAGPEGGNGRTAGEIDRLRAEHEILQQEYAEAVAGARKLQERVHWLEARLAEAGQPAFGLSADRPAFEPTSLMDALNMARETLAHVEIGDTDTEAAKLDLAYPTLARVWASKTWDALRALDAFARARSSGEFAGGFFDWCRSAARLTIPAGMVAMSESRTVNTNGKYSMRRTFAVPLEVHPSGKVLMEAHIKIRKGGCPAPRIHFHDDSGGSTGKIWIGHVGDHLPNPHTN
ncbi:MULTISPECIES: hypothetical protein [Streptosporangium]|uniref:Uncharacterized protein n=1 Tax=Streptosporangium brasiliense TaxID=47480 RepID=A0ABT9REG2_9ACTN|nr:hypothetical protein [Streptosporangium brasiliense]MDP9867647.1 hypothetical protein [Streptosporangium brasiliense]